MIPQHSDAGHSDAGRRDTEHGDARHRDARHGEEPERVVVRDRRRIDPETGQVRVPTSTGVPVGTDTSAGAGPAGGETEVVVDAEEVVGDPAEQKLVELSAQLDERTADLQRVSADYANYRRRVDRDREVVAVGARAQVAAQLLTVLDDLDRAAAHGDLTGAFKAVADKLVTVAKNVGLEPFGVAGEPFDPAVHEAVAHTTSPDVDVATVNLVMRQGYRIGDRVLRPAMVGVVDRDPSAAPEPAPGVPHAGEPGPPGPGPFGSSEPGPSGPCEAGPFGPSEPGPFGPGEQRNES